MQLDSIYKLYLECLNISTDSRNIASIVASNKKVIFFALKGDNFDGNRFIDKSLSDGASYAISDDKKYADNPNVVVVDDVLKTLQQLSTYHRDRLSANVIAITGSNGKTTTKELLMAVLSKKYRCSATVGNLNNHIGVPLTLLSIPQDCEVAIVEMGANNHKEIEFLCNIARPNIGLITNIGKAHLEGFGSQAGVAKAKGEMYQYLSQSGGVIVYDKSSEWLESLVEKMDLSMNQLVVYNSSDAISHTLPNGKLKVEYNDIEFISNLIGDYNKFNIVAVESVGKYLGVGVRDIVDAIANYQPTNKRSQLIEGENNRIIVDAYNANPSSMSLALDNFSKIDSSNKIVMLGDMKELGNYTEQEHLNILKQLECFNFKRVILVGKYFQKSMESYPQLVADWYESVEYLIKSIEQKPINGATILVKGSNSMKLDKVVEYIKGSSKNSPN